MTEVTTFLTRFIKDLGRKKKWRDRTTIILNN